MAPVQLELFNKNRNRETGDWQEFLSLEIRIKGIEDTFSPLSFVRLINEDVPTALFVDPLKRLENERERQGYQAICDGRSP